MSMTWCLDGHGIRTLVELLGRYSNWTSWANHLPGADKPGELRREGRSRARGKARRLSEYDVTDLVTRYSDGATVYDLAERFKIHRTTVSAHLHHQGARMRNRGMTERQTVEAAQLYRQGWSLAHLGEHFGVDGTTVWRELRQLGVPMRKPYERGAGPAGS
jgi:transposase